MPPDDPHLAAFFYHFKEQPLLHLLLLVSNFTNHFEYFNQKTNVPKIGSISNLLTIRYILYI